MKKVRLFLNEQKEERWINEMSEQGWHLERYNPMLMTFTFTKGEPGKYIYRVDSVYKQDKDYFEFVASTGAELVYKNIYWAYFRKPKEKGSFDLYTDYESKYNFLNRVVTVYLLVFILNFVSFLYNSAIVKTNIVDALWIMKALLVLNGGASILFLYLVVNTVKRKRKLKDASSIF